MTLDEANTVMTVAYYVRIVDAFTSDITIRVHDGTNLLDPG